MHLTGLLPCPSAPFDPEHPCNSSHLLQSYRLSLEYCQWPLGRGMGEYFFLPFWLEIFITAASQPWHHRPPSEVCASGLMPSVRRGLIDGCFHFPVAKAAIWDSSVFVTWSAHSPVSIWVVLLSSWDWQLGTCEQRCSHSHRLRVLNASWEHKNRLLWSSQHFSIKLNSALSYFK